MRERRAGVLALRKKQIDLKRSGTSVCPGAIEHMSREHRVHTYRRFAIRFTDACVRCLVTIRRTDKRMSFCLKNLYAPLPASNPLIPLSSFDTPLKEVPVTTILSLLLKYSPTSRFPLLFLSCYFEKRSRRRPKIRDTFCDPICWRVSLRLNYRIPPRTLRQI